MPRKITYLVLMILLLTAAESMGQGYFWQSGQKKQHYRYLSADAGVGLRMYSGDIQQKGALFNPLKFAYGLGVRYQYRPRLGFALHAGARGYKGKAEHGGFPDALDEMNGKLWEFSLMTQFSILRWEDFTQRMFTDRDPVRRMNVFVGVGAGGALFNGSYSSRKYKTEVLQDTAGRDSTAFIALDNSGSGAGFAFHVPVVLGARYRFNPSLFLSFEGHYDVYFSDNLDGLKRGRNDGMGLFIVKLGYAFGQTKKKGSIGLTPNQKRKLKK